MLKPGGHYFAISYGVPDSREYHFDQPHLSFENGSTDICVPEDDGDSRCHYLYVSRKLPDADQVSETNYESYINMLMEKTEQERQEIIANYHKEKKENSENNN